jgi:hypothetical protein
MKRSASLLAALGIAVAACGDQQLQPAQIDNVIDTVTLGALVGTSVSVASAYSIPDARVIRTDQSSAFDFAYDIDDAGRRLLLPLAALKLGSLNGTNPGLQRSTQTFDGIVDPPTNGYLTTDSLVVEVGNVLTGRSRITCNLGVPEYVKLEVLSFDDAKRTVTLKVLANVNCGYRNLQVGIPLK